jgi:hypothetical protein
MSACTARPGSSLELGAGEVSRRQVARDLHVSRTTIDRMLAAAGREPETWLSGGGPVEANAQPPLLSGMRSTNGNASGNCRGTALHVLPLISRAPVSSASRPGSAGRRYSRRSATDSSWSAVASSARPRSRTVRGTLRRGSITSRADHKWLALTVGCDEALMPTRVLQCPA